MLRHIDAAWDIRDGRQCVGFFIVEGDAESEVPEHDSTPRDERLSRTLSRRASRIDRRMLEPKSPTPFWGLRLGTVCQRLSIPEAVLIDCVV
jgi:hypothetical protein